MPPPRRRCDNGTAHPPASPSEGASGDAEAFQYAPCLRWARTIMRARMRKPWRICFLCSAVYPGKVPLGDVGTHLVGFLLSALLIPLLRIGLGGMQADLSAVDAG